MDMQLGKIIKLGRRKKGMTQDELAKMLGVTKVTIWAWETDKYSPDGKTLIQLGNVLDIVDELFPSRKPKSELEQRFEDRLSKIEQALSEKGIVKIENNNGLVVHGGNSSKVRIGGDVVKSE